MLYHEHEKHHISKLYFDIPHHCSTNSTTLIFQSMLPQIQPLQDDTVSYASPIKYVSLTMTQLQT